MARYEPFDRNSAQPVPSTVPQQETAKNCPKVPESEKMTALEKKVPLYVITATYPRLEQLAELTRLGNTLKHVKNMIWVVADDAQTPTKQIMQLLHRLNITHKYILGMKYDY